MATILGFHARSEIEEGLDNTLVDVSHRLLDLAIHDLQDGEDGEDEEDLDTWRQRPLKPMVQRGDRSYRDDYLIYQIHHRDGGVVLRSEDAPEHPLIDDQSPGFVSADRWRVYTYRHPEYPFYIQVADSLEHRRIATFESVIFLVGPLLAFLPLAGTLIYFSVRSALKPVGRLVKEIEHRDGGSLSDIDLSRMPTELAQIGSATNSLLGRLRDALDAERTSSAQIAHELRTPLASAIIELATAEKLAKGSGLVTMIENARKSLMSLSRRSERLLELSRVEQNTITQRREFNLVGLCQLSLEEYCDDETMTDAFSLVVPENADQIVGLGDSDSVAIMIRNLLDNAYCHGRSDKRIEIRFMRPATVYVIDFGPGIPAERVDELTRPSRRGSAEGSGFGLGLTIVKRLASRMKAVVRIEATEPESNSGCTVSIEFESPV